MPDLGERNDRRQIPYGRQSISDEDVAAVVEALRSDLITTGPRVPQFESALCAATGARHAVAVSSGTAALHTAYAAAGIGPGDEVITTALTFAATGNAALFLGARPVFVDVEPKYGTVDPGAVARAITNKTRAIVAVDYAGQPCDYSSLQAVATEAGVPLIADAAHSLGGSFRGVPVGTLATATVLSFHPVKHITTGEGGAILTNTTGIAAAARRFRSHGMVRDPSELELPDGPWSMEMQSLGYNYRLTDMQSALGMAQLSRLPRFLERRRYIATRYGDELADIPGLTLPSVRPGAEHAWHLYVVHVAGDPASRRALFETLRGQGLGVQVHYLPVYLHPYYRSLGYREGICPTAEELYARAISLPIFPAMTDSDVERVIDVVRAAAVAA